MKSDVFLILPPFTQLNTPYPSTAYLKGYLNTQQISSTQCDLGIELILKLFSKKGLSRIFDELERRPKISNQNSQRILSLKQDYISTIDLVLEFLKYKKPTLAHAICETDFLPQASRFNQLDDLDWAFGTMGLQDKARHLATMYLEDLSDLIKDEIDPHFGFSRYAEQLGRSAKSFDELEKKIEAKNSFIDESLLELLSEKFKSNEPKLVAISIPFPGNLYGGFKCAQWIKLNYPKIKIAMGGGYPNTELRSISDTRVFKYIDFITLDDGEIPIQHLVEFCRGDREIDDLKRTFLLENNLVAYKNNSLAKDLSQTEVGTPDYEGLPLKEYLSVIELSNPMHSLWSNGRWNKLTLAHGCYWGKCTFCDISLDYIKRYEQTAAPLLCDRIEELILKTGEHGFHFVDEAAPPALLRDLALEILRRDLKIVWWTNIRFEKSFSNDLCRLLKASGCIAMSGGLEVASDRLLQLIDKGVTVEQVAQVCRNFIDNGILVHAYLMYGYPTQTAQETIDSLEMVRQLFEQGVLQSGYWHRFAMTAHSPVGKNPELYKTKILENQEGPFANNDLEYDEPYGINHEIFSEGLRISLYNYMHGAGFDMPLQDWFEEKVPTTKVKSNFIHTVLNQPEPKKITPSARIIFIGNKPTKESFTKSKKGKELEYTKLVFTTKTVTQEVICEKNIGDWLFENFEQFLISNRAVLKFIDFRTQFETDLALDFDAFWQSEVGASLRLAGLMVV